MSKILVGHPGYGPVERRSLKAAYSSLRKDSPHTAPVMPTESSLLAHNFNDCVCIALNNGFDDICILHTDVCPENGWLDILYEEREAIGTKVIHAVSPIKDHRGVTSTAYAYSDEPWTLLRRLTMAESKKLPETWTLDDVQQTIDAKIKHVLPNTGCLLVSCDVLNDFPGFEIRDRIRKTVKEGKTVWLSEVVPEDWNFGFWCAANNIAVAGTRKVKLDHRGPENWPNTAVWGDPVDVFWDKRKDTPQQIDTVQHEVCYL